MTTNDPLADRFEKAWAEVNRLAQSACGMPPARPTRSRTPTRPCPHCEHPVEVDNPIVRGDESDTNKLFGICDECGHELSVDLRAERYDEMESYEQDRRAERRSV